MQIPATSSTMAAAGTVVLEGANPRSAKKALDADDFMKLLSAQLNAQDPLNPMKDTEFVAQMASFTSVEQTRALHNDFTKFAASQSLANTAALLGKPVTLNDPQSGLIMGAVQAATLEEGVPTVVIGGKSYDASLITRIGSSS